MYMRAYVCCLVGPNTFGWQICMQHYIHTYVANDFIGLAVGVAKEKIIGAPALSSVPFV